MNKDQMRLNNDRLSQLRKRCPWMASLIQHCLATQNLKSCEIMRTMLARLRMNSI